MSSEIGKKGIATEEVISQSFQISSISGDELLANYHYLNNNLAMIKVSVPIVYFSPPRPLLLSSAAFPQLMSSGLPTAVSRKKRGKSKDVLVVFLFFQMCLFENRSNF